MWTQVSQTSEAFLFRVKTMSINKEKLLELQKILQDEYGSYLSEENLLDEALRLSEFARTVLRFHLSRSENINNK